MTPTAEAASTIAPFAGVLLGFISGVWIPVDQLPDWLVEVGRVFPLAHLAESLQRAVADPLARHRPDRGERGRARRLGDRRADRGGAGLPLGAPGPPGLSLNPG